MLAQNGIIAIYSEDTAPDIRFIINDSMEEGVYNVDLTLSDGLDSTTYTIEVYIIKNTPPYYKKTMGPLIYRNIGTEVY